MPSIDTKPHIEAKRSIMWGFIVVIPANRRVIFKRKIHMFPNKALLPSKQGFIAL